nr:protein borderless isoform X2 [Halyomorpha halys]
MSPIILFLSAVYIQSGIAKFIEEEKKPIYLSAHVGESVVFSCDLDFPQGVIIPYILYYYKEGEKVVSLQDEDTETGTDYIGRASIQTDGSRARLTLSGLRETDHGWYECRLFFPNRTPTTRLNGTWYHLTVHGRELLSMPPKNETVLEGETVRMECSTREPGARVTWYKDGSLLEPGSARVSPGGALVFQSAGVSDPGLYTCQVISPAGRSQSASAYLDVRYKARVVYTEKEVYLPFGRPGILDCHFSANPPLTKLRWEKDGFLFDPFNVPGVFSKRNGSLYFNKVDETHGGEYTCTPYNDLGTLGPSPRIRVVVQHPPVFTLTPHNMYLRRTGDSILMPCDALDGDSAHRPTILWFKKDGSPLPDRATVSGGNLTIININESDRGMYQCVASNEAATISADTELLIEGSAPRGPYNLTGNVTYTSVTLSWRPASPATSDQYSVWVRAADGAEWRTVKVSGDRATITSLDPGREYEFMVLVQDHNGDGMFSKPIKLKTKGKPVEVQGSTPTASQSIMVGDLQEGGVYHFQVKAVTVNNKETTSDTFILHVPVYQTASIPYMFAGFVGFVLAAALVCAYTNRLYFQRKIEALKSRH